MALSGVGDGGEMVDLSELPSDKAALRKEIEHMVSIVGPELFIKSSNAENQAIMKANATSGAGEGVAAAVADAAASTNGNPNPSGDLSLQTNSGQSLEEKEAGDSFDLVLKFLTFLMTKTYAEAYSVGQEVLAREPGNTAVKPLMDLLEKLIAMPAEDADGLSDSDFDSSDGSDSLNSDFSDTSDELSLSDEESGSGSGSGSESSSDNESPLASDPESDLDPFAVIGGSEAPGSGLATAVTSDVDGVGVGSALGDSEMDSLAEQFKKASL